MVIGIDASNIRAGGGLTHLIEVLRVADPLTHGFSKVVVWGGQATLDQLDDRDWLVKSGHSLLNGPLPARAFWQRFLLSRLARMSGCQVLFVPGGSFAGNFRPVVAMSQNLLPFEWPELRRYGTSWMGLKLRLLRLTQARTFRRAAGIVFLTEYARGAVMTVIGATTAATTVIAHGIAGRFSFPPRQQAAIEQYSTVRPFRVLYVSIVDVYKHQQHVVAAIAQLRATGLPVVLELIGPAYPPALAQLTRTIDRLDQDRAFVHYAGAVSYDALHAHYAGADLFVFASSCENMPMILLEGMAAGLPIVCSDRGPMPEVLGDAGVYCNPEDPQAIARGILELIASPGLRAEKARAASERARLFSWQRCASETFAFLARIAKSADEQRLDAAW